MTWIFLALSAAVANSVHQAYLNKLVSLKRFPKSVILFFSFLIGSLFLLVFAFLKGIPVIGDGFWTAVFITCILNFIASPIMLKAYELGEFSTVYSMILLTPVFLFLTSYLFLGEMVSVVGAFGVILTIVGLGLGVRNGGDGHVREGHKYSNHFISIALGILVAAIYSITVNFDKLSALRSNAVFAAGIVSFVLAVFYGIYLVVNWRNNVGAIQTIFSGNNFLMLVGVGAVFAFAQIFHNLALTFGFVSYTIALKRLGILFGVLWGWLFFREQNFRKKILGAAIAVAGVVLIVLA